MSRPRLAHLIWVLPFLVLNLAAWAWVRHDMLAERERGVRVVAVLPAGDADEASSVAIVFDRPLGGEGGPPPDSLFRAVPALPGTFAWAGPGRLECRLDAPLPPGREWRLFAADGFAALTGYDLLGDRSFAVRTRAPALESTQIESIDAETVTARLRFNQPVAPAELARRLAVTGVRHRTVAARVETPAPARELVVRLARQPGERAWTGTVAAGLTGDGGDRPMPAPAVFGLVQHEELLAEGVGVTDWTPDGRAILALWFSSPLDRRLPPPAVAVSPAVPDLAVAHDSWDRAMRLTGSFACGTRYTITVPAGTPGAEGLSLAADGVLYYRVPDREPAVTFPFARGFLSPGGHLELAVEAVNAPRLLLRAWRVHDNNLAAALSGHRKESTSRPVAEREVAGTEEPNRSESLVLSLASLLPDARGLYLIEASVPPHAWRRDRAVVAVTDLGITARRGRDGLLAWVVSLAGGAPVADARVVALSATNQPLAEARTGPDGLARLAVPANHPDGEPWLVVAEREGDRSFLLLPESRVILDDVPQDGRRVPENWDVMLYTERGAYRPGDVIHVTALVRRPDGSPAPEVPLQVAAQRPDGREALVRPVVVGAQGFLHADLPTPADGQTGPWRIVARLPGGTKPLAATEALVEAFVPARLALEARATSALVRAGEPAEAEVAARYLFGLPGAGLPLAATFRHEPAALESAAFPRYVFGVRAADPRPPAALPPATLDAEGRARLTFPPPEAPGRYRLAVTATVTEPGSRSVSRRFATVVDTARRHVGLLPPAGGWVPVGGPVAVSFVERSPEDGEAAPGPFSWTLSRLDEHWEVRRAGSRWSYEVVETAVEVARGEVAAAAAGEFAVVCPDAGRYRLEATDPETGLVTRLALLAAGGEEAARKAALASADRLEILPARPAAAPGTTLPVLVRSPFPGTMLLTVEGTEVEEARVLALTGHETTVEVAVPANARGSLYLSASVVRPVDTRSTDWRLHRAAGLVRVVVDHEAGGLPLTLAAPAEAAPGSEIEVTVTVPRIPGEPAPVVHLFAVDEGILAVTDYATPDPRAHFFAPRAAAVAAADLYGDLLPDLLRPAGVRRIGGDAGDGMALRRSSVPVTAKAAAVVWREAAPVGDDGRLTVRLPLPDLTGTLRVMAVAAAGDRYACAEREVVLAADVMVEAGFPRFLALGDRCRVPVRVFNRRAEPLALDLAAEAARVTAVLAPARLEVPAGGDATAWLTLTAAEEGPAEVVVTLAAAGSPLPPVRGAFPVRPAGPLHSAARAFSLAAGEEREVAPEPGFRPGARRRLSVAATPALELRPAVEALLGYPYGCLEQTTSRALALLFAPALLASDAAAAERAREYVGAGIARIATMQTPSGGLSYWPGDTRPDRWATSYAASFLAAAAAQGHALPAGLADGVCRYLARALDAVGGDAPEPSERALLCAVLAAFGRPPQGWMDRLAERPGDLDLEGAARLAAAFLAAGRRDRAETILTDDLLSRSPPRTLAGRLTSPVAGDAAAVAVLCDLDPAHPWLPRLADRLLAARAEGRWGSTLDDAAAVSALSRLQVLAGPAAAEPPAFTVTARCGEAAATADGKGAEGILLPPGDGPVVLSVAGRGRAYLLLTTEGLLAGGRDETADRGLAVRREWKDRSGRPLEGAALRVGDLVRVEVTLRAPGNGAVVPSVAVVDALPGGFEVENPRLATSAADGGAIGDAADRVEFLDDRVVLFAAAPFEGRRFVYHLRAVAEGEFALPPVQASCMYEPAYSSISGGGRVEVAR